MPTKAKTPCEEYPFIRGKTEEDEKENITNKKKEIEKLVSDDIRFGSQHADVAPSDLTAIGLKCFSECETI